MSIPTPARSDYLGESKAISSYFRFVIGVEDGTRRVAGVSDAQKLEEQLASMIWDRIEPRLAPEIHVIP